MGEIIFSKHAIEQMELRGISLEIVKGILAAPQQAIIETGKIIFQSIVNFEHEKEYLVRIFVNTGKEPNVVITVYRTSKFEKYYES